MAWRRVASSSREGWAFSARAATGSGVSRRGGVAQGAAAHRAGRAAAGARTRGLTARGAWGACVAPQTGSTRTVGCGRRELWCRGVRRELDLKRAPCVGRARLGAGARQRTAIRVDVPYACRYSVTL
eukprot:3227713-Prymnesium_polylepis.1